MKHNKTMKRVITMIVVLCMALTALTAGAFADNSSKTGPAAVCTKAEQETISAKLYVDNDSDDDVMQFYMALASDAEAGNWGDDLLGSYYSRAFDGHVDVNCHVHYQPDVLFRVRVVTRSGMEYTSEAFSIGNISDPESVTIVFHGPNAEFQFGVR